MKLINKAFFVVLTVFITSCSLDDSSDNQSFEMLPIESITLPDEFVLDEVYDIDFTFIRPTNCHGYYDIFINAEDENRTVGVTSVVYENSNCIEINEDNIAEQTFRFQVIYDQTYVFHIWKGVDVDGEDIYEVYEVPVVN
jgi:hypothetical protein